MPLQERAKHGLQENMTSDRPDLRRHKAKAPEQRRPQNAGGDAPRREVDKKKRRDGVIRMQHGN